MKIRFLALLLTLCLLLPLTALATAAPLLPDLGAFAGDLLELGDTEDFGFCKRVTFYGSKENVQLVAESYIEQLLAKHDFSKHAHFSTFYENGQFCRYYALGYTGETEVGTVGYDNAAEGWQISDAAIVLTYSQYHTDNFIQLTYRAEFNYKDTGERMETPTRQTLPAAPTPSTSSATEAQTASAQAINVPSVATCTLCSGTGAYTAACSVCQGAGVSAHTCATCNGRSSNTCASCGGTKYMQCGSCDGHGSRSCSSCGGTGHHSSSSHHGSSHRSNSSSKCSSCGGDGKRNCSSCGGDGQRNCTTCRAAGRQDCPDCIGGSISSVCSGCDGTGHRNLSCTNCNGTGIIK